MELILFVLLVLGLMVLLNALSTIGTPNDNRESYARDGQGRVWALYVAGPVGDVPNHERFIHDGTPHQNPAVNSYTALSWFLIFPFPEECEERWYPITNNGTPVNPDAIRQRIHQVQLRRRQTVELTTMPRWAEKQAIRREHGEQLQRGVPAGKLHKRGR